MHIALIAGVPCRNDIPNLVMKFVWVKGVVRLNKAGSVEVVSAVALCEIDIFPLFFKASNLCGDDYVKLQCLILLYIFIWNLPLFVQTVTSDPGAGIRVF